MKADLSSLPMFAYDLVVADPAWDFELYSDAGGSKSASEQYETMTLAEIEEMRVGDLVAMNSWCLMWAVAPLLPAAIGVMAKWGFVYKTFIVWRKVTVNGKVRMGTGYIARSMAEIVLIGSLGRPAYAKALPGIFDGIAREHSRKPEEFFALVERFAPKARKLELFAGPPREGWDRWGKPRQRRSDRVAPLDDSQQMMVS